MSVGLPKQIDVQRLVASEGLIEGNMACQADGRLAGMILGCESDIQVSLAFGKRDDGGPGIEGRVQCTVSMQCQRCLEPVSVKLDCPVALGIITSESQADQLPGTVEPLIYGDGPVDLAELIEDELILALPIVPVHEQCDSPVKQAGHADNQETVKKDSPFAVLKGLKGK